MYKLEENSKIDDFELLAMAKAYKDSGGDFQRYMDIHEYQDKDIERAEHYFLEGKQLFEYMSNITLFEFLEENLNYRASEDNVESISDIIIEDTGYSKF